MGTIRSPPRCSTPLCRKVVLADLRPCSRQLGCREQMQLHQAPISTCRPWASVVAAWRSLVVGKLVFYVTAARMSLRYLLVRFGSVQGRARAYKCSCPLYRCNALGWSGLPCDPRFLRHPSFQIAHRYSVGPLSKHVASAQLWVIYWTSYEISPMSHTAAPTTIQKRLARPCLPDPTRRAANPS